MITHHHCRIQQSTKSCNLRVTNYRLSWDVSTVALVRLQSTPFVLGRTTLALYIFRSSYTCRMGCFGPWAMGHAVWRPRRAWGPMSLARHFQLARRVCLRCGEAMGGARLGIEFIMITWWWWWLLLLWDVELFILCDYYYFFFLFYIPYISIHSISFHHTISP